MLRNPLAVDLRDNEAAAAAAPAVNASGGATAKTTVLLTLEQVDEAAKRSVGIARRAADPARLAGVLGVGSCARVRGVATTIHGAGVKIRLATTDEVKAFERARLGGELVFEPSRSVRGVERAYPPAENDVHVVGQAFVEFSDEEGAHRWDSAEFHGLAVSRARDATLELLRLAEEAADEGLIELLSDMRIAGLGVSRWALMSAPRRIELEADLEAALAPLRRG